jgi:hypothetical protein
VLIFKLNPKKIFTMSPPNSSPAESKYIIESIAVREFFKDYGKQLCLRLVNSEKSLGRSTIRERSVNRPALAVTGYFKYFANKRIQLFGAGEMGFFPGAILGEKKKCYGNHGGEENSLRCGVQKSGTHSGNGGSVGEKWSSVISIITLIESIYHGSNNAFGGKVCSPLELSWNTFGHSWNWYPYSGR